MRYNWELPDWPFFRYDTKVLEPLLYQFVLETGEISGLLKSLPEQVKQESLLEIMLLEAVKTSEIEGEFLSRQDIMSSIRNNLGLNQIPENVRDRKSQGIGALMVDVRKTYREPLTRATLMRWHEMVLAAAVHIQAGQWRSGSEPMQIISGTIGKETVHFQAPPSTQVPFEMERFIKWFNETGPGGENPLISGPVRAAIAHLYFESIHPFADGNGRIGRAIAEKALSQTLDRPLMLSLSRTIEADKKSYYAALELAQKSNEITEWIGYFADVVLNAQIESRQLIDFSLRKAQFFDKNGKLLNDRHLKVIKKIFEAGKDGFEGGMSAKKYMSITKTSKATATRDLQFLVQNGIFTPAGAGRSVRYNLIFDNSI